MTPAMQAVRRWTSSSSLIRAAKPQKHKHSQFVHDKPLQTHF